MTRVHAKKLALVARAHGDGWQLCSPMPGKFRPHIRTGSALVADGVVGLLEVLGTSHELVVPATAAGYVTNELDTRVVQFGDVVIELAAGAVTGATQKAAASTTAAQAHGLVFRAPTSGRFYGRSSPDKPAFVTAGDELTTGATHKAAASSTAAQAHGLVFRAPTSGRFYGRSSPDKPAFVTAGDELTTGATVCLLEVMKTFHRVHYGGTDVPERARVREVLVKDGDDVNAGDALLGLDPV